MRYYLIDEITSSDMEKINHFLQEEALKSPLEKLFWVQVPEKHLNDTQKAHCNCLPYVFAIELGQDWLKAEFFVRSQNDLKCSCSGYCTPVQRNFVIDYIQDMVETLEIRT